LANLCDEIITKEKKHLKIIFIGCELLSGNINNRL